jgi:putative flippase GtrA
LPINDPIVSNVKFLPTPCFDLNIIHIGILSFGFWYQLANLLAYFSGTLVSFFLNRIITFRVNDKVGQRLVLFLGASSVGYAVSSGLLWFLVEKSYMNAKIAKLLTLPAVVFIQFYINKRFTFKKF